MLLSLVLATALAASAAPEPASPGPVLPGVHQLLRAPYLELIRGKRLAVLAHAASRAADGAHLVDLLHARTDLKLAMILAPEHGFRGEEDTQLPDRVDPVTRLPVYSLYGPRKAPTREMLAQVDAVVIDLQDVGVRFYTYASTMAYTLQACKEAGKKVLILDRPNPIGGERVEGAVLEPAFQGNIIALYPIATRHGMTMGELARLYNEAFGIGADLSVVPMAGWKRGMPWEETGLKWLAPSPALIALEQARLYGVFGTLEALNLAVGRGATNEEAFRVFGAPWISKAEAESLVASLSGLGLPGLRFSYVEWIPTRREFEGRLCRGFRVELADGRVVQGFRSLIEVMQTLHRQLGERLGLEKSARFLGARWLLDGIAAGTPSAELQERAERESARFREQRARALLY